MDSSLVGDGIGGVISFIGFEPWLLAIQCKVDIKRKFHENLWKIVTIVGGFIA